MTKGAKEFLDQWVSQHITPLSHDENDTEAKGSVRMCLADAERYGSFGVGIAPHIEVW
jgi:hypothetical protein